ncbi:MAG: DegV family EDD domain-containing protein [Lachnospiraceae bacterium]|nr:DegV family EDD domain-containing protein [Lachnospiraceae bacterium]
MKLFDFFKKASDAVKDYNRDFNHRIFLILSLVVEGVVIVAITGDLIMGDNPREIAVIASTLILIPIVVLVCLYFEKLNLGIKIIMLCVVFLTIPSLFFFGGGLEGGGVLWIIIAYMYVGLFLHGRWRKGMYLIVTAVALICYVVSYYHPEWVYPHTRKMFFVDSFISLVLVGTLCYIMTWAQGHLFTDENRRAKKEAERAEELTRSQNRFFSNMSHEIRTPINSILGLNELILRNEKTPDEVVKDASGIQGAGKMLLALINDILDFSKIEAGSMDIVPVDYRIGDMLSEIVNMIWLRAHDKGLGFEVSVDPDVPMVLYGDEVRIKQVMINLLNNAVKYTKEGHVELRVESKDIDENTIELLISISDTGMGIKKEDLPYLFDAFKRVDEGKNRHIEGTGLGLNIVKQLVELMNGTVTVNSVYGEGSTFTVMLKQTVSDHNPVGELDIHNQQMMKRSNYESSFLAPEVRILIVDDNEMNLKVEKRLLEDTDMAIDTAKSGREALEMSTTYHYDAIFMDHLMPEMDGIECLELLRNQAGGLNRSTPVIVLTANAGSTNRDLYAKSGFDGYLVKPVSSEAMEEMLVRHIPGEKIILRSALIGNDEEIHISEKYAERVPVIVTASSMCDLPDNVIKKLNIPILPVIIKTEDGVFKDGVHMDAIELIKHVAEGKEAYSVLSGEAEYTEFFAGVLKKAHHVIHIATTDSMRGDNHAAREAAKSFDNVTVINSETTSSAAGILVLIACKLVHQGMAAEDIVLELESVKKKLNCSFVINTTDFLAKKGLISKRMNRIADAVNIHPIFKTRNDKGRIEKLAFGRTKRAYRQYIHGAFTPGFPPDKDVVFITYVDIPADMLAWIVEEVKKCAAFEHVVLQQASAAISLNCGSGTFGIMYFHKTGKSYNIASFIEDNSRIAKDLPEDDAVNETDEQAEQTQQTKERDDSGIEIRSYEPVAAVEPSRSFGMTLERKWYQNIKCIDTKIGIKNCESEETFKAVLDMFVEAVPETIEELDGCFDAEDWENYTIKIHALKGSAKLVGAAELGDMAEKLQFAGDENNIQYIKDNHAAAMENYRRLGEALAPVFEE